MVCGDPIYLAKFVCLHSKRGRVVSPAVTIWMDETVLMNLVLNCRMKMHLQETFSIKSNESFMKVFPKASFGYPHALIDSILLKIWSLIMLAHIHLKPKTFYCFKCEACTSRANFQGVLKNHIICIHVSKCELWMWNLHLNFRILWKSGESYLLTAFYLKPKPFPKESFGVPIA